MARLLFIDESGHDRIASPYEVLAGVAIQDRVVSAVIERLHDAEYRCATPKEGKAMKHQRCPKASNCDCADDSAGCQAIAVPNRAPDYPRQGG